MQLARAQAFAMPLDQIDVSKPRLFQDGSVGHYFERLRRDAPVHYQTNAINGGFWSVTKYKDIMQVDTNHAVYSSDWGLGGITLFDEPMAERRPSFIAMDPPLHDEQRKSVSPIDNPNQFIIDRARPRQHLSFGFGIHRCVGNRLAEMQLKILWEEILKRFPVIEVVGEPKRVLSNFVRGFTYLPVRLPG